MHRTWLINDDPTFSVNGPHPNQGSASLHKPNESPLINLNLAAFELARVVTTTVDH